MAYLLSPQTIGNNDIPYLTTADIELLALRFFSERCADPAAAYKEFKDFRNRQGVFASTSPVWLLQHNIARFWACAVELAPGIGQLALRLSRTPASTVPAERSFSNMKVIHTSIRNSLLPERVRKLLYIYMNTRALQQSDQRSHQMVANTTDSQHHGQGKDEEREAELIQLENEMMAIGQSGENNPEYKAIVAPFLKGEHVEPPPGRD